MTSTHSEDRELDEWNGAESLEITNTKSIDKMKASDSLGAVLQAADEDLEEKPASICETVWSMMSNIIPAGSALSSGISLASTSVGAGIVGMPSGFSSVGYVMALIYIAAVTAETAYSLGLLAEVAERTGLKTYEDLARHLLHKKGHIAVAIIRVLHTLGGTVVFVVTIRDLVSPIVTSMNDVPSFVTSAVGLRVIQAILFGIFMLPLVIPRYINAVRYVAAVGITFIVYLSIIVVVESCKNGLHNPKAPVYVAQTGNGALQGVGVFIFSYMCQINCLEIYFEMTKRSVKRFALCAWISMSLCGLLYVFTGLFGYLEFGDSLQGSLLVLYNPIEKPAILVCYIGVFIKICASFSLVSFACRSALFPLFGWDPKTVAFRKHLIGSVGMALINLLLGVFVPNISMVLSFFGGFCGGQVGFILPALFVMYAGDWSLKKVGFINYLCTYLMLIAGVIAVVLGTASSIYSATTA